MKKAAFIDLLASDPRIGSVDAARESLEAVLEGISAALAQGEEVRFSGFGKFTVSVRKPREGINPRTGERITIPGGPLPTFSAGAALKARVRGR